MIKHVHVNRYEVPDVLQITAAGWDGQILSMSRQAYFAWRKSSKGWSMASAVYVLYADHFDKVDGRQLYVGRTGDPIRRGKEHELVRPEWTAALIFTSMGDWMSATHIEVIEANFIEWVKSASRYLVTNGTEGAADPHAGKADQLLIGAYLAPIREIVQMSGVDIFMPNRRGVFTLDDVEIFGRTPIKCLVKIADAETGQFEVLAGSAIRVRAEPEGKTPSPIRDKIASLTGSGHAVLHEYDLLRFGQNAIVQAERGYNTWKLFGVQTSKWQDDNRQPLTKVLPPPSETPPDVLPPGSTGPDTTKSNASSKH